MNPIISRSYPAEPSRAQTLASAKAADPDTPQAATNAETPSQPGARTNIGPRNATNPVANRNHGA